VSGAGPGSQALSPVPLPLLPASLSLPPWPCLLPHGPVLLPPWPCLRGLASVALTPAMTLLMPLLPPSVFMDCGYVGHGPCLLLIIHNFCHIHWMCCNAVHLYTWHLLLLSILERDPPLLLSSRLFFLFSPWKIWGVLWEFFLIRREVKGQGCCMCIVKPSEAKL